MRNKDLFLDPKDAEIARLKLIIAKFKKYDERRKNFYKEKMERLGALESYLLELESEDSGQLIALKEKIRNQTKELGRLHNIVSAYRNMKILNEEEEPLAVSVINLKQQNKTLRARIERLHKSINQLTCKITAANKTDV